ncbi:hypothetical protein [Microcystis aeruginosa]|uniref:Similar to tr/Q4C7Z4/Q4C7Z4_CROWT Hypothetical protein n=1 Tax=Microcystis aeruginosa (strain PCC 7806) TaxID=267872 RepID=A8YEB8_MICA7|nr:hypothetical protein [Microcystis aeruginosa]TRT95749.1 MAG: hypothetical protein EWV61_21785 [Microcystis aeruginosa Ma_AC_P_19900807_S300]UGS07108.1 hypothetical protein LRR78_12385 [Microcystis aeruginosa FACHB-905 = DIANCHI905]UGS10929.1 hypothetical protein LRR78_10200 [Microcystis aeruginosa FACHB-905 = DIANCHI905]WKX62064.1 hypothetical protein Q3H53_002045 [Microcystis aeruginosa PCC 7806]WKX62459.1 hypothetical protein Q3H53_002472 [Microcystis aeruginosa PCC 7806]
MARKRFSDLERVYDALKLGNVNLNSLPQNLDFVKYGKWREGNGEERNIVRPPLNGEVEVGVIAFGYGFANAKGKVRVTLSGRSSAFLNSFSPKAKFGVATDNLTPYNTNKSFVPAKARIATIVAVKSPTSKITGRRYKTRVGPAYTVPMGRISDSFDYQETLDSILADPVFSGANATHTVSFDPEEFRRD